jgi:hypothetical protein
MPASAADFANFHYQHPHDILCKRNPGIVYKSWFLLQFGEAYAHVLTNEIGNQLYLKSRQGLYDYYKHGKYLGCYEYF